MSPGLQPVCAAILNRVPGPTPCRPFEAAPGVAGRSGVSCHLRRSRRPNSSNGSPAAAKAAPARTVFLAGKVGRDGVQCIACAVQVSQHRHPQRISSDSIGHRERRQHQGTRPPTRPAAYRKPGRASPWSAMRIVMPEVIPGRRLPRVWSRAACPLALAPSSARTPSAPAYHRRMSMSSAGRCLHGRSRLRLEWCRQRQRVTSVQRQQRGACCLKLKAMTLTNSESASPAAVLGLAVTNGQLSCWCVALRAGAAFPRIRASMLIARPSRHRRQPCAAQFAAALYRRWCGPDSSLPGAGISRASIASPAPAVGTPAARRHEPQPPESRDGSNTAHQGTFSARSGRWAVALNRRAEWRAGR